MNDLTVFAFAFLDECFVFDVFVAGFAIVPGSGIELFYFRNQMIWSTNLDTVEHIVLFTVTNITQKLQE